MGFLFMKNIFKVVFVIIGTLIGAGFASGQEVYIFFFSHGQKGILGLIISNIIIGFVIYKTLLYVEKNNTLTYKEFLKKILRIEKKNSFIIEIINMIINIFILITFFIMIAGFGAYFEQELGINKILGSVILSSACFFILMKDVKGVVKANGILVPILILFLIIIGCLLFTKINFFEIKNSLVEINKRNFLLNSILYSSYNSILLIPIILTLKQYIKNSKQIIKITVFSTFIILVLSLIIFFSLIKVDVDIRLLEMPAVYVVSKLFKGVKSLYAIIILGSIFTTAISLGMSFLNNVAKNKDNYKRICGIICFMAVIVSNIGFSNLVSLLYPIFG